MIFKRITNDVAKRFPRISGHCRYCKKPLQNKRLSWCGGWMAPNGCFTKAQQEGSWGHLRQAAWKRSKGKCELCGFDIAAMFKALSDYNQNARKETKDDKGCYNFQLASNRTQAFAKIIYGVKARNWPHDCWAADHILPISEGGDCLPGLEGVRILDLECHDKVTAELRRRLSERRKRHRFMPLFPKP